MKVEVLLIIARSNIAELQTKLHVYFSPMAPFQLHTFGARPITMKPQIIRCTVLPFWLPEPIIS